MTADQIQTGNCTIELLRGDITKIAVDAIVNAANSMLAGGGGVDGAIHAAGGPTLMEELSRYGECPAGSCVVTGAGRLPAKIVIHAVGPVYRGGGRGEAKLLASCYRVALELASERECGSISFPGISTGIYGYPVAEAAEVAFSAIVDTLPRLKNAISVVKLVQFNQQGYEAYLNLFQRFSGRSAEGQTRQGQTRQAQTS